MDKVWFEIHYFETDGNIFLYKPVILNLDLWVHVTQYSPTKSSFLWIPFFTNYSLQTLVTHFKKILLLIEIRKYVLWDSLWQTLWFLLARLVILL